MRTTREGLPMMVAVQGIHHGGLTIAGFGLMGLNAQGDYVQLLASDGAGNWLWLRSETA